MRVGCVTFNNDGTATVRVSHYTTVHYGLNESRVRNVQQRRHCNGARLALYTVHCGLNESRVRNFQQRRHCNGARLVLHIVHCGLKKRGEYFQQRQQFNGARLVPYHRSHIMADHDTDKIQAMLKFCPHFDGKDKAHCLDYKDKLRVVLLFHRQSVAAILQGDPKPPAAQISTAVATWELANENLFSILFFATGRSANNVVKQHMGKTLEDGSVTDKQHGMPWKRSTTTTPRRLEGRTTKSCTVLK